MAQNTAGTLDTSFGNAGIVTTTPATLGGSITPLAAIEEPNGDIAAAVGVTNGNAENFSLVLYAPDGTLIGNASASFFAGGINNPSAMEVQPDGAIVVVGTASAGAEQPIEGAIARFTPGGQLDATFGNGGLVTTAINGASPKVTTVLLQPNGQILVGGSAGSGKARVTTLIRYNANGSLDTNFGTSGISQSHTKLFAPAALALLSNGDYLAVGENSAATKIGLVAEFSPMGALKAKIDRATIVVAPTASQGGATPAIFQPNGDYIIGDTVCTFHSNCQGTKVGAQRFNEKGAGDSSFNADSFYSFDENQTTSTLQAIAVQSNGQVVTGGTVNDEASILGGLARLNTNGQLDTAFGTVDPFGVCCTVTSDQIVSGLLIQADGKIVAVGGIDGNLALARYLAN